MSDLIQFDQFRGDCLMSVIFVVARFKHCWQPEPCFPQFDLPPPSMEHGEFR
jgi:hypothetical protein